MEAGDLFETTHVEEMIALHAEARGATLFETAAATLGTAAPVGAAGQLWALTDHDELGGAGSRAPRSNIFDGSAAGEYAETAPAARSQSQIGRDAR